jgi:hypothetical protein
MAAEASSEYFSRPSLCSGGEVWVIFGASDGFADIPCALKLFLTSF